MGLLRRLLDCLASLWRWSGLPPPPGDQNILHLVKDVKQGQDEVRKIKTDQEETRKLHAIQLEQQKKLAELMGQIQV